jgi:hypothetical protein
MIDHCCIDNIDSIIITPKGPLVPTRDKPVLGCIV